MCEASLALLLMQSSQTLLHVVGLAHFSLVKLISALQQVIHFKAADCIGFCLQSDGFVITICLQAASLLFGFLPLLFDFQLVKNLQEARYSALTDYSALCNNSQ
jgi:hypothetical protein